MAIHRETQKENLDWRLVVAIFFQESSLKLDPQGCMKDVKRCTSDFGIGQVRAKVWQKAFPIDRTKLMTDVNYSVSTSIKVLVDYKRRYAKQELNWFTRYHHTNYEFRTAYMQRLNKTFAKINKHLQIQDARKVAAAP